MLFNSVEFTLFLPIVFLVYWSRQGRRWQNFILVLSGLFFYGWWDWRFLGLLLLTSLTDWAAAQAMERWPLHKKLWLTFSLLGNLGTLAYFKYAGFFIENFASAFTLFGNSFQLSTLKLVLPLGISFYTFQALSYTIDVYRGQLKARRSILDFLTFVCFFPQLVAGPIERGGHMLPQYEKERVLLPHLATDGVRQLLWGLFKKMVVADNCAPFVNEVFSKDPSNFNSPQLILTAILFSVQIYCDFSGYSDMAVGLARLFGVELMQNFRTPYFSRSIQEFWHRWHISLSLWFRDYVYIPLGGSRVGVARKIRNTLIVFLLSGLWHGANWTFVAWGGLNGLLLLPQAITKNAPSEIKPSFTVSGVQIITTFLLVTVAWVFFRSPTIGYAAQYLSRMVLSFSFVLPPLPAKLLLTILLAIFLFAMEARMQPGMRHVLDIKLLPDNKFYRYGIYYSLLIAVLLIGGIPQQFIYFQF